MAYCKKYFILFLVLFLLLFNTGFVFATEDESVDVSVVSNIVLNNNGNYFVSSDSGSTGYITIEKGYSYTITNLSSTNNYNYAFSNDIPALNVIYYNKGSLLPGTEYTFISDSNSYLYFDYSWYSQNVKITRQKLNNQENAINDLVDNVGPNALWGVFGSGIDFVFVVVIVAFGIFIIVKLIKGLSKGKSKI